MRHWYGLQQDFWSVIHEFRAIDVHTYDTPTRHQYGLQQDFWSVIDEFRAYDIHAYDTPSVSTIIWSDSSYRRVSLLHVHGNLVQR